MAVLGMKNGIVMMNNVQKIAMILFLLISHKICAKKIILLDNGYILRKIKLSQG